MCHEERDEVFALLAELGARPVDIASELTTLIPRMQTRAELYDVLGYTGYEQRDRAYFGPEKGPRG